MRAASAKAVCPAFSINLSMAHAGVLAQLAGAGRAFGPGASLLGTLPETQFTLAEIPQRVERGLRWLRAQPNVRAVDRRIGVIGASRGGELALLAAATLPDLFGPVVGYVGRWS